MKDNSTNLKRGRKPVHVDWPNCEFTASDVAKKMEGRLSRVSVNSKINDDLKNVNVNIEIKNECKMGRPCFIYKKND